MIELTDQQRQELKTPEPLVIDPETRETYVLVRRELYERMKSLWEEDDTVYTTADLLDRTMAEDDAHDPSLDEWQKKYGGRA
jgi:hypothetical protein